MTTSLDPQTVTLLNAARNGNDEAWAGIYERYRAYLGYVVRMQLEGSPQRQFGTEDVLQDAFLKAWTRLGSFEYRGEGSFLAWLTRIVLNLVRNRQRAPRNAEHGLETAALAGAAERDAPSGESPSDVLIQAEARERLRQAFALLPKRDQMILGLRIGQGLTWAQIAEILGSTRGVVSQRFIRSIERIGRSTGDQPPRPGNRS